MDESLAVVKVRKVFLIFRVLVRYGLKRNGKFIFLTLFLAERRAGKKRWVLYSELNVDNGNQTPLPLFGVSIALYFIT